MTFLKFYIIIINLYIKDFRFYYYKKSHIIKNKLLYLNLLYKFFSRFDFLL